MAIITTPTAIDADSYATIAEADDYLAAKAKFSTWDAYASTEKARFLKAATRQVDLLRFGSVPMVYTNMYYRQEQKLKFPLLTGNHFFTNATSATSTTITSNNLIDLQYMPDDIWNDGVVIITDGTGRGQTRRISDFVSATGVITVDTAFDTTPDASSQLLLVEDYDDEVVWGTIEQAFFLALRRDDTLRSRVEGLKSRRIDDVSESYSIPKTIGYNGVIYSQECLGYLMRYIDNTGTIQT